MAGRTPPKLPQSIALVERTPTPCPTCLSNIVDAMAVSMGDMGSDTGTVLWVLLV